MKSLFDLIQRHHKWIGILLVLPLALLSSRYITLVLHPYYRSELSPILPPDQTRLFISTRAAANAVLAWTGDNLLSDLAPERQKLIALTFDDGPYPLYTPVLLDLLKRYHVRATFFLVGARVREFPQLADEIAAAGHEIGNHTFSHKREAELGSPENLKRDILQAEAEITTATGVRPHLFRMAGGHLSPDGIKIVRSLGYTLVDASVNPGDWWLKDPDLILQGFFKGRSKEGVVLLHTGATGTLKALPAYIDQMRRKGFRFVTVSELAASIGYNLPPNPRLGTGITAREYAGCRREELRAIHKPHTIASYASLISP